MGGFARCRAGPPPPANSRCTTAAAERVIFSSWKAPARCACDAQVSTIFEFLSAGDAVFTRRVKAKSARHAVVVRFSKTRRRYERQGLLVEPHALTEVQRALSQSV